MHACMHALSAQRGYFGIFMAFVGALRTWGDPASLTWVSGFMKVHFFIALQLLATLRQLKNGACPKVLYSLMLNEGETRSIRYAAQGEHLTNWRGPLALSLGQLVWHQRLGTPWDF